MSWRERRYCPAGHDTHATGRDRESHCYQCRREQSRQYRQHNRAHVRDYDRRRRLHALAAGLCAICRQDVAVTDTRCFNCAGRQDEYNVTRTGG